MSITPPSTTAPHTKGEEMATTGTALGRAAWVAGASAVAMAVYQVATPGAPAGTYESWNDYLRQLLTLAYLADRSSLQEPPGVPGSHPGPRPGW